MSKIDIGIFVPIIGTTWASEIGGEEAVIEELLKDAAKDGICYLDICIMEECDPNPKSFNSAAKINLNAAEGVEAWDPPLKTAPFPGWREKFLGIANDILSQLKARYKPS